MWPCRVALSLPQRHPTTCGLAPTINTSRQVTVSQHVTENRDVTGYQSRAEQNPLTPTWDCAGLDTAFPGDSKCLHS